MTIIIRDGMNMGTKKPSEDSRNVVLPVFRVSREGGITLGLRGGEYDMGKFVGSWCIFVDGFQIMIMGTDVGVGCYQVQEVFRNGWRLR